VSASADAAIVLTDDEPYSVRLASKYVSVSGRTPQDRRQYSRQRESELEWIKNVRVKATANVALVDLSAGGALIDSPVPLRPGTVFALEIVGRGIEATVATRVLRSHVSALAADSARYRGACEFAQPIALPGIHPLPDPAASVDPFVGVDSALKRLVERAYAVDASERLAAGDVILVLQSLARRALSVDDPLGRSIGTLLQELLPALRHGYPLPTVLTTIERQLSDVLPETRVRLVGIDAAPARGTRSVLINVPGEGPSAAVSIDLPATGAISTTQAGLLRTSSRVIALAQRLNGFAGTGAIMPSPGAVASASQHSPEAESAAVGWQKVVVRYADGQMLKGFTQDFHGSRSQFSLWPSVTAASHERVVVPLALLKAVFFVREFRGDPDYVEQKVFESAAHGRRIEVTLLDDEVIVGTTLNYRTDSAGFFVFPADIRANNQRVFIVSSAVRQVRFP
jgi:hypothetical protein